MATYIKSTQLNPEVQHVDDALASLCAKGLIVEVAPGEYKLTEDGERIMAQLPPLPKKGIFDQ